MPKPFRKRLTFTVKTTCRSCGGTGFFVLRPAPEHSVKVFCVCVEVEPIEVSDG